MTTAGGHGSASPSGPRDRSRDTAHDDLVRRDFTATGPNELWLTDITEHWTREGKLYLCAIKDVFSNRIVGWSIDSRMKPVWSSQRSRWLSPDATATWRAASSTRTEVRNFAHGRRTEHWPGTASSVRWARSAPPATTPRWNRLRVAEERARPRRLGDPRRAPHRDRDLDRTHLSPPSTPSPIGRLTPIEYEIMTPRDGDRCLTARCRAEAAAGHAEANRRTLAEAASRMRQAGTPSSSTAGGTR